MGIIRAALISNFICYDVDSPIFDMIHNSGLNAR